MRVLSLFARGRLRGSGLGAVLIGLLAPMLCESVSATPWGNVKYPSSGAPQVIGGASNGCLGGAESLPATGPGYVSVRRYRNRYYGHPQLLRFIADMGRAQEARGSGLVMIGDLSQPRGGRMSSSHRSHQNGLDVDIWLTLASSQVQASQRMDNRSDPDSMVAPGGRKVSRAWGPSQHAIVESAARHPKVDRIFVNAAIKQALCQETRGDRGWLRKVRPWWGHDAHMHVRLVCPPGSPECRAQDPVPAGDGCGADLAWWLSDEALHPRKKGRSEPAREPEMPIACRAVLSDD